ncbi:MAG: hypothetical protein SWK90_02120 [Chloroflexota bacterium]|nr:hypothetical protein [Chloroflexota bacterium]
MKKQKAIGMAMGVLLLVTLACGGSASTPPPPTSTQPPEPTELPPTQPPPTQPPTATPEVGGGKSGAVPTAVPVGGGEPGGRKGGGGVTGRSATLTLANYSSQEVCYVYISPVTEDEWGDDWLGAQETVPPNSDRQFDVPAGSYDLLAADCDGNDLDEQYDISIAGALEWTLSDVEDVDDTVALTLFNDSGWDVCYVYISPATSDTWGSDWLGADIVPDGTSYTFEVPVGSYDLLAEGCDEDALAEEYGVSISEDIDWLINPTGGEAATLTVYNYTDTSIWYIYISPSTSDTWGDDWLGSDVIPADESYTFELTAGTFDVKAEDENHNVMATRFDEYISDDVEWTLYLEDYATLTLSNNSGVGVCYVYISPSDSTSWGDDWLGAEEVIASGDSRTFQVPMGTYDLLAEDCDRNALAEEYEVDLSVALEWTLTP